MHVFRFLAEAKRRLIRRNGGNGDEESVSGEAEFAACEAERSSDEVDSPAWHPEPPGRTEATSRGFPRVTMVKRGFVGADVRRVVKISRKSPRDRAVDEFPLRDGLRGVRSLQIRRLVS